LASRGSFVEGIGIAASPQSLPEIMETAAPVLSARKERRLITFTPEFA
jgi:hypothetical protein